MSALLQLFAEDYAALVREMRAALKAQLAGHAAALNSFYDRTKPIDFSKDVLEVQAHRLQVIRVPPCGWTDLGTPQRVEATVRSIAVGEELARRRQPPTPLFFDLGAHYF